MEWQTALSNCSSTGEWILVTAAVGGVGIAAVQIAKALGAKVIAAVGSDEKIEIAKRYGGADHCVSTTRKRDGKKMSSPLLKAKE
jgi:NADPH:quinone reductase-like Zn-dependent oxidoreductase